MQRAEASASITQICGKDLSEKVATSYISLVIVLLHVSQHRTVLHVAQIFMLGQDVLHFAEERILCETNEGGKQISVISFEYASISCIFVAERWFTSGTEAFETCRWNPENWLIHFLPHSCRSLQSRPQRRSAAKKIEQFKLFLIFYVWKTTKLGFDFFLRQENKRIPYLMCLRQGANTFFRQLKDHVEVTYVGPGRMWKRTDESQVDQQSDGWRQQERPHHHHCHGSSKKLF